jgi:Flp pilus assembly protein TadD
MARARTAPSAGAWQEVRRLVARANRADPNDPEPLVLFYQSFAAQGIAPTRNAVDGLLRAFELAPQDTGLRMNVARQLLVEGKAAEARAALAPIAFDPHGGPLGQTVAAVIATLDKSGARAALEAWEAARQREKKSD